jgi:stringent starvation protein B
MAPTARLPPKKDVALALLEQASMYIHLDPRADSVQVPAWFKKQPQLVLQVGLNMAVPIPDLHVDETGLSCTLSFNRAPFFCMIPWPAVFALVGENGQAMVWAEDVPAEVSAQAQAQKAPPPKPRAHLRSVGEGESAPPPAAEPAAPATARDKKVAEKKAATTVTAGDEILPTVVNRKASKSKAKAPSKTAKPGAAAKGPAKKPVAPKAAKPEPSTAAKPEPAAATQAAPAKKSGQPKAEPARAATEINKPKRELPPYLRVVK